MQPVSVILGSHCHVPDGLAETEYEMAYNKRLKPFLSALYCYPEIPAVLHCSGPLFYWVERRKSELFTLIRKMLKRKQIEILSGGFYEPAMQFLAPQDRTGQVEMLSTYIRRHFGKRSTGAWIPGECWEQSVVTPLSNCAIEYTFLPERFFSAAGIEAAELGQPVYAENQGALIMVFPMLPFGMENGKAADGEVLTVRNLSALIDERGRNGVYTIFPERFSANEEDPQADICAFLEGSISPAMNINWTIPSRFREGQSRSAKNPFRKLYFSDGGGRSFLAQCPDANAVYAKMVYTRDFVRLLRGDRERKNAALHKVYKAQVYNLYSASARPNITEPELRHAAYRSLLSAEHLGRETKNVPKSLYSFDFDFDGRQEDIFRGDTLNFYVHRRGGSVFGIDYIPVSWNYMASFRNHSFVETLYPDSVALRDVSGDDALGKAAAGLAVRNGLAAIDLAAVRCCGDEWWEETGADRAKQKLTLSLPVAPSGAAFEHIGIEKTYRLKKDTIEVHYTVRNAGTAEERFVFCLELHLSFAKTEEWPLRVLAVKGDERSQIAANDTYASDIDGFLFQDLYNETVVDFSSDERFGAILGLDGAFDRCQSHRVTVLLPVVLQKGATISREFRFTVTH
jgi:alpha-amylase